ncbi:unnamed protein product [Malus baccata var. baccata]
MLIQLSTLSISLDLSDNYLTGTLPFEVGDLVHLTELNVLRNNLSGEIPNSLDGCASLERLYLQGNKFQGTIPQSLKDLKALEKLDLSSNNLYGQIPEFIGKFGVLKYLNLSYNDFEGELPKEGFSVDNLIGLGSFGSVYKGVIPSDGTLVAVKVLNLQKQRASKSFIDECKALRSIRHRNLLKIITACSSIDNQGKDFKSLVFEFMANGSLDSMYYPRYKDESPSKRMSFMQRLNIAIDVASALDYLHHHCETTIIHYDLKPSNVLLDEHMVAHVGDFGLAMFLFETSDDPSFNQTMSSQLKGSIGYIHPAMTLPDHVMDVVDHLIILDLETNGDVNNDIVRERTSSRSNNGGLVKAKKLKECLVLVMHIGLSCCAMLPRERMLMDAVVIKMSAIRDSYLKNFND